MQPSPDGSGSVGATTPSPEVFAPSPTVLPPSVAVVVDPYDAPSLQPTDLYLLSTEQPVIVRAEDIGNDDDGDDDDDDDDDGADDGGYDDDDDYDDDDEDDDDFDGLSGIHGGSQGDGNISSSSISSSDGAAGGGGDSGVDGDGCVPDYPLGTIETMTTADARIEAVAIDSQVGFLSLVSCAILSNKKCYNTHAFVLFLNRSREFRADLGRKISVEVETRLTSGDESTPMSCTMAVVLLSDSSVSLNGCGPGVQLCSLVLVRCGQCVRNYLFVCFVFHFSPRCTIPRSAALALPPPGYVTSREKQNENVFYTLGVEK